MTAQLTLPFALREAGMSLAAAAQERASPGWSDRAFAEMRRLARQQETVFTDDLTPFLEQDPAPHFNAIGSIWLRAVKAGIIERTSATRWSTDPKKHAHACPVYRSMVFGARE
jgi:hypothetical protein